MKTIRVEDAVGTVLCHDITRIVPGEFKGPAFRKGHIITPEDIPELLKLGKEHIYVWELGAGMVHEDDAAIRLAKAIMGNGLSMSEPREGKVNLIATSDGMCVINEDLLMEINLIEEVVVATRNHRRPVKLGEVVAGVRVVPLVFPQQHLERVETLCHQHEVIEVKPFNPYKVGIVTTGNEVFSGYIEDKFGPVLEEKIKKYNCSLQKQIIVPDDPQQITHSILELINQGAEMVLITGGMSVDPDDLTPAAVRATGAEIITYGAPVLPGAMLMVAYMGDLPILGLPGCVMYSKITIFDLIMPTILTGEKITRAMIARLGMGGLCLNCPQCHYPACGFGSGA
ncbi:MAG: molybdopterin-binding protein [Syntrophomonadaceae bacterium]|jgi:molybdenum cofactor synthesis domain-containing protein|nr:molybdopterin-binding protein [Syntrophomonadaceae bacterium]